MAVNKLIFQSADKAKAAITDAAKKDIAKLYSDWADEIGKKAEYYKTKTTASSWLQEQNMRQLQAQLTATSKQISNEVYGIAKDSIYKVSDAVVQANNKWLIDLGFPVDGVNSAFVSVPDQTVRRLITGQIYDSGWSLSKSIWSDNEKTLQDIYGIVAKGLAQNMSAYDISKLLETYVNPSRAKQWNLTMPDGVKIYKKAVDYNAQRLVRTLVQHGYQQSFIATTQKNPFIEYYIWRANGSRTCELCAARDGKKYAKDELPMDHPNGMCTMEPYVDNDNMIDQLADWVNNPDGTYPEIDEFAKQFGYEPSVKESVKNNQSTNATAQAVNPVKLIGGTNDPELTDSIHDYYLPSSTRAKLSEFEQMTTYNDFEKYLKTKGIELDTDLVKLKTTMANDDIPAVKEMMQKVVTAIDSYEETYGADALSALKKIKLYDEDLDTHAAYHFNLVGEKDPFAGTIRFSDWEATGRDIFHELGHALQDSLKNDDEDIIIFTNRLAKKINIPKTAYSGTGELIGEEAAENMAENLAFGFARGNKKGQQFIKDLQDELNKEKYLKINQSTTTKTIVPKIHTTGKHATSVPTSVKNDLLTYILDSEGESIVNTVDDETVTYIKNHMITTNKTMYRVEDAKFTASKIDVGSTFQFNDDFRSFTSSEQSMYDILNESESFNPKATHVVFKTTGENKTFSMNEYVGTTHEFASQNEYILNGQFEVVDKYYDDDDTLIILIKQIKKK